VTSQDSGQENDTFKGFEVPFRLAYLNSQACMHALLHRLHLNWDEAHEASLQIIIFLCSNVILVIRLPRSTIAVEQASLVCLLPVDSRYLSYQHIALKEEQSVSFPFQ